MANILVTGGAGYIGSHVVKMLGELGHNITVIDNLSTGRAQSVLYGELIEMDLSNLEKLEKLIQDKSFDACLHFAGSIIVPESVSRPEEYYNNNLLNSYHLLRLCRKYHINRFIFSSTAAVYGDIEGGICTEDSPLAPINPYGKSKLMVEWMLEDYSKAYSDFEYVALRYFNVAGANIDGKIGQCSKVSTHLIKIASELAVGKRKEMYIFGDDYDTPDGTCIRDYIHIDDLASAHIDSFNYLLNHGESAVMNCGYGKGFSVKSILATMEEIVGKSLNIKIGPRRDGDPPTLVSQSKKISDTIQWTPKYNDIKLICKTAYEWEKIISEGSEVYA